MEKNNDTPRIPHLHTRFSENITENITEVMFYSQTSFKIHSWTSCGVRIHRMPRRLLDLLQMLSSACRTCAGSFSIGEGPVLLTWTNNTAQGFGRNLCGQRCFGFERLFCELRNGRNSPMSVIARFFTTCAMLRASNWMLVSACGVFCPHKHRNCPTMPTRVTITFLKLTSASSGGGFALCTQQLRQKKIV